MPIDQEQQRTQVSQPANQPTCQSCQPHQSTRSFKLQQPRGLPYPDSASCHWILGSLIIAGGPKAARLTYHTVRGLHLSAGPGRDHINSRPIIASTDLLHLLTNVDCFLDFQDRGGGRSCLLAERIVVGTARIMDSGHVSQLFVPRLFHCWPDTDYCTDCTAR